MDKILLLSIICLLGLLSSPHAAGFRASSPLMDTTDQNTSLLTLNPKAIPFVKDYLDLHQQRLRRMKTSAQPYFTVIENILEEKGLPKELKYLAVIESNLKSNAVSWAGAAGPWQFMPATGRLMGLKITSRTDERRDLFKSTYAAARYLKQLYTELNDWLLVIAAYNSGSLRVQSAIKKTGSRDFWDLQHHLPAESRTHVKKFIATHFILEGQGGITTTGANDQERLALASLSPELLSGTVLQTISGKYLSSVIIRITGIDPLLFRQLNPQFDKKVSTEGYGMRLPEKNMVVFNDNEMEILDESVRTLLLSIPFSEDPPSKEVELPSTPDPMKKSSVAAVRKS
jgi:membrane-bound lytic murein transglycosylase D